MPTRPVLLGHRGLRGDQAIPENSVAAFDRCLNDGCDGFELDVRQTAGGRLVICHDAKVDGITVRNAGPTELNHLPDLPEVLRGFGGRGFLDIELKVAGLEARVLTALRERRPERDYVVSSFLPDVLLEIKVRSPTPVGVICENTSQLVAAHKLPVEYVIVQGALVTQELIEVVHGAGRRLFVWTVNQPADMIRFAGWGVDGIISDDPKLLAETLTS